MTRAKAVKLRVSSLLGEGKATLGTGSMKYETAVPVCDTYDDFAEVMVPTEPSRSDILDVSVTEGMCLLDIEIINS